MKGKIFDIKKFAVHDGDGIRTTVFFKGCPLGCIWCHNPEGISASPSLAYRAEKCVGCGDCARVCPVGAHSLSEGVHRVDRTKCIACGACADACLFDAITLYGKEVTVEELLPKLLADRVFYENSGGGVTISGGECLSQPDFAAALLCALQKEGIHTAVDTSGFVSRATLDKVIPYTDVFLYDIKAIDEQMHQRYTGVSNKIILENLRYLDERGCKTEVRIPFVPGCNDKDIAAIADLLRSLTHLTKVHVLPYHNLAGSKYNALSMENTLPSRLPTEEELASAKAILRQNGLPVYD